MQRLARIKQLAHAYVVFPSAVHNRLEHSLGTLTLAGRLCDQLRITGTEKKAVRAAALLHDVGHGPFSHLFEEVMRFVNGEDYSHENVTRMIIEHDSKVRRALGKLREYVLGVFDGNSLASEIVSSSLDADKLDYLRRDSYHTGVAYGIFDLERIVRTVCRVHETDRDYIAIDEKGKDALESYRLARYSMHVQVYEHHTRLVADDKFLKAVIKSIKDGYLSKDYFDASNPETFLTKYEELDDASIEHYILQNAHGVAKELIQDIRARRLLKRAFVLPLTKDGVPNALRRERLISMTKDAIKQNEEKMAREVGIDPERVIVHLQSVNIKLYERFEQSIGKKDKPILVRKRDGAIASFDEESPISASMNPIRRLFVFCPEEHLHDVGKIAIDIFQPA